MAQLVRMSLGMLLSCLFVSGCHTPLALKQIQAKNPLAKNAAKTPVEIVDAWNSYAHTTPEGKIVRGMAGRVHFYETQNKGQPVKVDGDLTVYVFDGNDTDPAHTKPFKIFQFKADTLAEHHSHQKPLGHGYNFFLPIDEIGGEEKPLSIIVRFDNRLDDLFITTLQPVNTVLAGRRPQTPAAPSIREFLDSRSLLAETNWTMTTQFASAIQQAAYITTTEVAEPEDSPETSPQNSRVRTIPLNSSMTRRLAETTEPNSTETDSIPEPQPLTQN